MRKSSAIASFAMERTIGFIVSGKRESEILGEAIRILYSFRMEVPPLQSNRGVWRTHHAAVPVCHRQTNQAERIRFPRPGWMLQWLLLGLHPDCNP